jgi:hypothetical protein
MQSRANDIELTDHKLVDLIAPPRQSGVNDLEERSVPGPRVGTGIPSLDRRWWLDLSHRPPAGRLTILA